MLMLFMLGGLVHGRHRHLRGIRRVPAREWRCRAGLFAQELQRKLEPFAVMFLLPLFFTYSGLNTRLDMVNTPQLLLIALAVLAAACLGKGGACWAAARLARRGQPRPPSPSAPS